MVELMQKKSEEQVTSFSLNKQERNITNRLENTTKFSINDLNEKQQTTINTLKELQNKNMVGEIRIEEKNGEINIYAENKVKSRSLNTATSMALNELELGASEKYKKLKDEGVITNKKPTGKEHFVLNGNEFEKKELSFTERAKNGIENFVM